MIFFISLMCKNWTSDPETVLLSHPNIIFFCCILNTAILVQLERIMLTTLTCCSCAICLLRLAMSSLMIKVNSWISTGLSSKIVFFLKKKYNLCLTNSNLFIKTFLFKNVIFLSFSQEKICRHILLSFFSYF